MQNNTFLECEWGNTYQDGGSTTRVFWKNAPESGGHGGCARPACKARGMAARAAKPKPCTLAVYSWYGLLNAQLTTNGGGRRPPLSWWFDAPLTKTRLTMPKETVAAASLPDDYLQYVHERNDDCE